ncbi:hypothetical protein GCM10025875_34530 [Litorihabitans aurantiacus]|uniref:DUF418 domain-containing protein n=2 Tax=Litorihabitans aurantiacus TaxID=1930061 RepID=A0AA37XCM2_9MICO|nr:hypothetical protein GCM10025875_00050 [Litorihabitans aurantiacus]GMA33461.1 hypothetical protein GCM10025875_34530 [Litorihabitans aurantiacus]
MATPPVAPPVAAPAAAPPTGAAGPTAMTGRSLAPDLARGTMLLLIVLANIPWYLYAATKRDISEHPVDGSVIDRVVQTVMLVAVDARSYPMFAALFGYGIWQLYTRQAAAGTEHRAARRLLRRRNWWLVAFGAVHAVLLWSGDVLGAYGLAGVILVALFIDRASAVLRIWAIVIAGLLTVVSALTLAVSIALADTDLFAAGGSVEDPIETGVAEPGYLASIVDRSLMWVVAVPSQVFLSGVIPVVILVGILAARHRVLEEPERHLPLLRRTAVVGLAIGWTGAPPPPRSTSTCGVCPRRRTWAS